MQRKLFVKLNPNRTDANPAKYHVWMRDYSTNPPTDSRFQLSGFSYFGEVGGLRHIPEGPEYVVLYPDRNSPDRVVSVAGTPPQPGIRRTYAQYLAHLAAHKVTMVRTWAFEPYNPAESYPFFHHFGSDQYNLDVISTRYLRRLVRFIEIARRHGIVVHLTIASCQMLRLNLWNNIPFSPKHSTVDYFAGTPKEAFCSIGDGPANARYRVERALISKLTEAVKPYWNVMFELMNEAGVPPVPVELAQWHRKVATWLTEDLPDGEGGRSHLITTSPLYKEQPVLEDYRTPIMNECFVNRKSLIDVVSFHGGGWGGPDDTNPGEPTIRAETRKAVNTFYQQFPNHQTAVICDSDAMPIAQQRPDLYGKIVLGLNLDYGHRWQETYLAPGEFENQLDRMETAGAGVTRHPDPAPNPGAIPVVSADEAVVAGGWRTHPGIQAVDLGVFRHDSVWALGHPKIGNDFTIYRLVNGAWTTVPGHAVRISVGPAGPWVVNSARNIYRWTGSGFQQMPGGAYDIGVGADDLPWVIGTNPTAGGFALYRWNGQNWVGEAAPTGGVRIAVNPVGEPWITTSTQAIWTRDGSRWIEVPGGAHDVGVGLDDTAWVIGTNPVGGGFGIYYWLGTAFGGIDGGATAIAVDHDGLPWVANSAGMVYQRAVADTV